MVESVNGYWLPTHKVHHWPRIMNWVWRRKYPQIITLQKGCITLNNHTLFNVFVLHAEKISRRYRPMMVLISLTEQWWGYLQLLGPCLLGPPPLPPPQAVVWRPWACPDISWPVPEIPPSSWTVCKHLVFCQKWEDIYLRLWDVLPRTSRCSIMVKDVSLEI